MVKKLLLIASILAFFGTTASMAKWEMKYIQVKGEKYSWDNLKEGDQMLMQNGAGTLNMAYANCKYQALESVFLNGEYRPWDANRLNVTDQSLTNDPNDVGDQLFELVNAPAQLETVDGEQVERPSFYIKHVKTGLFLCCNNEKTDDQYSHLGPIEEATSFWPQQAIDDEFKSGREAYGSTWVVSGHVDEMTCVWTHIAPDGTRMHFGPFWNYGWSYFGPALDIIPWNLWTQAFSLSAVANLRQYYAEIKNQFYDINGLIPKYGETAGYYNDQDAVYDMEDLMTAKLETYDIEGKGVGEPLTEEIAQQFIDELDAATEALENARVSFHEGYYRFVSAYPEYENQQRVRKGMLATTHHTLGWANENEEDAFQIFKVTKANEGRWFIQNLCTDEYIGTVEGTSKVVPTTLEPEIEQIVSNFGYYPSWGIYNTENELTYHTAGHSDGVGESGDIVTWAGNAGGASSWFPIEVEDLDLVNQLKEESKKIFASQVVQEAINEAKAARSLAFNYDKLVSPSKGVVMANTGNGSANYSLTNLVDDDINTIYESDWQGTLCQENNNLQFDLVEATDHFKWYERALPGAKYSVHSLPNDIILYGTNDETLGADPNSANEEWDEIAEYDPSVITIANKMDAEWTSPDITLPKAYRFLRFEVNGTTTGTLNSASVYYYNVSEFQVLDSKPSAHSEYNVVPGMKEAVDALDELVKAAEASIEANEANIADTAAIYAAAKKVRETYVDRPAFDKMMDNLEKEAATTYKEVMGQGLKLVTDVNQISVNSNNDGATAGFAAMIDGVVSGTYSGIEAIYDSQTEIVKDPYTAEEWLSWLEANRSGRYTGYGYRNYQVALSMPVDKFQFNIVGRDNSDYHDTPCEWDIYVTNDDELGASTDNADNDKWKFVQNLVAPAEELKNERAANWTSPEIELDGSYKYVRFVIKNTTIYRENVLRTRPVHPEITGIIWNAIEWQVYGSLSENQRQYNYVEGMKEAVDAMMALKEASEQREPESMYDSTEYKKLRAAIDAVKALKVDTTEYVKKYNLYKSIADNATAGEGVGYVDGQDAIDTYVAAVAAAKAMVSPTQPQAAAIDASLAAFDEAYNALEAHVTMPEAGKWYNIFNATTRAENQPIFLADISAGDKAHTYTYADNEASTDPYAIFRLVAGEDGLYAIQSLGTGLYLNIGTGTSNNVTLGEEAQGFKVWYFGDGTFKIQNPEVEDFDNQLKADQSNGIIVNWTADGDRQREWKFEEVEGDAGLTISYWFNNTISVMTLPFETKGDLSLMNLNEGVKTYGIKSLTTTEEGTKLELVIKNDFEAGEPMIIETGDYTAEDKSELFPLIIACPENVVDKAIQSNGLVGTLSGLTLAKPGLGYFANSELKATTDSNLKVTGRNGFIDPNLVENKEGKADLVIEIGNVLDGVKATTTGGVYNNGIFDFGGKVISIDQLKNGIINGKKVFFNKK